MLAAFASIIRTDGIFNTRLSLDAANNLQGDQIKHSSMQPVGQHWHSQAHHFHQIHQQLQLTLCNTDNLIRARHQLHDGHVSSNLHLALLHACMHACMQQQQHCTKSITPHTYSQPGNHRQSLCCHSTLSLTVSYSSAEQCIPCLHSAVIHVHLVDISQSNCMASSMLFSF